MQFTIAIVIVILLFVQISANKCPSDCICYEEYLSDLESWKWIENDVNIQRDDPNHGDFNPYTEHNDVYDNPKTIKKRQTEQILTSVTCVLRSNDSAEIMKLMESLRFSVQVLSLIQAPGTGQITLTYDYLSNFDSLVGFELQGYTESLMLLEADAFSALTDNLRYLNLQSIQIQQNPVPQDLKKFTYNTEFVQDSQVIVIQAKPTQQETIVPYSVYKTEGKQKSVVTSIEPNIYVAFTKLPYLEHLRISECNLQDLSWDMFYKLDNLKYLVLDNNELLFLPDFVFYSTPNLVTLSLTRNRILSLQTAGLAGLLTLQKLDVSYNNITYLSELSLPPFPHMEVADFRENPIEVIFPNTFEIMNSTHTLFLGSVGTPLELSPNSFYGLISLERLDVLNARIEFLERVILKGMPNLKSLTLTGNITRIMYDAFSGLPKLEKLIMKRCSIKKISMDAFFGLSSLLELDLSHNQLSFLPPGIFDEQVSLREIFLQYNNLQALPPSIFSNVPAKIIRLEGNPWHCSCDMKYWNPKQTDRVKRYHVQLPNTTHCDPRTTKRACLNEAYEPKLEVKYVHEKRVSPLCAGPPKFKNKSVSEVLRKELKLKCTTSLQQNISILLTSSNPTETLEILGSLQAKEVEKELLFPSKLTKSPKVSKTEMQTAPSIAQDSSSTSSFLPSVPTTALTFPLSSSTLIVSPILLPDPISYEPSPTTTTKKERQRDKRRGQGRPKKNKNSDPDPAATELLSDDMNNNINVMWSPIILSRNGADSTNLLSSTKQKFPFQASEKALKYTNQRGNRKPSKST